MNEPLDGSPLVIRSRGLRGDGWAVSVMAAFVLGLLPLALVVDETPTTWTLAAALVVLVLFCVGTVVAAVDAGWGWVSITKEADAWYVHRGSPMRRRSSTLVDPSRIASVEIVDTGRPSTIPGGNGGRVVRLYWVRMPMQHGPSSLDLGTGLKLSELQLEALVRKLEGIRAGSGVSA